MGFARAGAERAQAWHNAAHHGKDRSAARLPAFKRRSPAAPAGCSQLSPGHALLSELLGGVAGVAVQAGMPLLRFLPELLGLLLGMPVSGFQGCLVNVFGKGSASAGPSRDIHIWASAPG